MSMSSELTGSQDVLIAATARLDLFRQKKGLSLYWMQTEQCAHLSINGIISDNTNRRSTAVVEESLHLDGHQMFNYTHSYQIFKRPCKLLQVFCFFLNKGCHTITQRKEKNKINQY